MAKAKWQQIIDTLNNGGRITRYSFDEPNVFEKNAIFGTPIKGNTQTKLEKMGAIKWHRDYDKQGRTVQVAELTDAYRVTPPPAAAPTGQQADEVIPADIVQVRKYNEPNRTYNLFKSSDTWSETSIPVTDERYALVEEALSGWDVSFDYGVKVYTRPQSVASEPSADGLAVDEPDALDGVDCVWCSDNSMVLETADRVTIREVDSKSGLFRIIRQYIQSWYSELNGSGKLYSRYAPHDELEDARAEIARLQSELAAARAERDALGRQVAAYRHDELEQIGDLVYGPPPMSPTLAGLMAGDEQTVYSEYQAQLDDHLYSADDVRRYLDLEG